jgi:iduronate 2-sulfatase
MIRGLAGILMVIVVVGSATGPLAAEPARPNVLFISIDDLRPALGCYGDPLAKTPHIDRLAAGGRPFLAAYCQQAVCGPSRTAVLTGRLPDNNRVWHNRQRFRLHEPDTITLPQLFIKAGYRAESYGKVFSGNSQEEDPESWSAPAVLKASGWRNYAGSGSGSGAGKGSATEAADVDDEGYPDGRLATMAIAALERLRGEPFFLAVGFFKPHLPFNAPRKYWDLHDPAAFGAADVERTAAAAAEAYPDHRELAGYAGMPRDERVTTDEARRLRQGYYACASYVDAQVGRLLTALDRLGLADDTIVVLWGDHGYSLGEADHWCKATNFERDTRVPLVIRVPGMPAAGEPATALVELVDLYPTLAELAGRAPPAELDGRSLGPILRDPSAPGKAFALSQYVRPWKPAAPRVMGYSLRSPTHRYTRWVNWADKAVVAEELYDYGRLPGPGDGATPFVERTNAAADPSQTAALGRHRAALDAMLAERTRPSAAKPLVATEGGKGKKKKGKREPVSADD